MSAVAISAAADVPRVAAGDDPGTVPELTPDLIVLVARRFRVLSEPTRIMLLDLLRERESSVMELTESVGTSQQNVSKHLRLLLQEGVVRRRKHGGYTYYSIADEGVFALCENVCGSLSRQADALRETVAGRG